eukprot:TRINITY_DN1840_c0_g1_i1.p2 TRINITY_DN1840_c0_g1~~TRINITY_DN1840_c0_g1_i1.p2  ORF type:complete len:59 (-),score=9.82 TRINITY_DN1840_c0_g1_i1:188-364(-)
MENYWKGTGNTSAKKVNTQINTSGKKKIVSLTGKKRPIPAKNQPLYLLKVKKAHLSFS